MKLTDLFPNSLLKAQNVTDAGGEMPLTIKSIEIHEFDGDSGKEKKPIITFTSDQQVVLNKTNANMLAEMFGDDTDKWIGKEITLIVQDVDFQGKQVPAIRIKNINSKDMLIQEYWQEVRASGMERKDGLDHLKLYNNDFAAALNGLKTPL